MKNIGKASIIIVVIVGTWFTLSTLGIFSSYVLPSPLKVWNTFLDMVLSGVLWDHILISMQRVLTGFIIAFVFAFLLGTFAGLKPNANIYYNHVIEFMRNVPPLSLIALLILWFGIGETSKLIVIILAAFFPMFLNIKKGFLSCDKKLLEVGDSLGLSTVRKFIQIMLPFALPDILMGMRVGLGYSWRAIIGAEMIAASSGLGYLILDAQQMSRSDKVIVGIITIGIVGCICDKVFSMVIKKAVHGGVDDSWS